MKKLLIIAMILMNTGCYFKGKSFSDVFYDVKNSFNPSYEAKAQLNTDNAIVVCRAKQCAPAKISMSKEYIYNSLLQLFENNSKSTALICQGSPTAHACLENYVTVPIKVGITPANMYIDSVKISDVNIKKGSQKINLLLNYNVTFNGQSPDCTTADAMIYAKTPEHVLLEDNNFTCQMTSVGRTSISTVFAIDYIDLDYGFIGGYYSIGLSGPAYGGGSGYMLIRLMKDAYPLSPELTSKGAYELKEAEGLYGIKLADDNADDGQENSNVKVFPINKK